MVVVGFGGNSKGEKGPQLHTSSAISRGTSSYFLLLGRLEVSTVPQDEIS